MFQHSGRALFLPFLKKYALAIVEFAANPGMAVAWEQLIFNLVMVSAALLMLQLFHRQVQSLDANRSPALVSGA